MTPLLLALATLLPHPVPQEPARPAEPRGRILFTRQLDRRDDLFVLHLPEGRLERVTDHRAKDSHGVPSPDGRRIVFNSEREGWWKIWTMDADGTAIERLTSPARGADYHPCWSPDGREVLYVSGSQGNGDLVCLPLDGGEPRNLTRHPAHDNFPAWSPDGAWIAFASDRADREWSIHVMKPDGSEVRRVTRGGQALEPAWFPDGRRLAWQVAAPDGKGTHLVTQALDDGLPVGAPVALTDGSHGDERPAVSPDGRWVVFESDRAGGSQLFLVPSAGGEPRRLTHEGYCYGAAWFPDAGD